jgi:plasmid stabilization system protein ParE
VARSAGRTRGQVVSRPVIIRPEAQTDIQAARDTLDQAQAGLGDRFAARLRDLFERIEAMPELYGIVWQDVRVARVRRFRYIVAYVVFPERVEVLAVLHGAQDPSRWQSRV